MVAASGLVAAGRRACWPPGASSRAAGMASRVTRPLGVARPTACTPPSATTLALPSRATCGAGSTASSSGSATRPAPRWSTTWRDDRRRIATRGGSARRDHRDRRSRGRGRDLRTIARPGEPLGGNRGCGLAGCPRRPTLATPAEQARNLVQQINPVGLRTISGAGLGHRVSAQVGPLALRGFTLDCVTAGGQDCSFTCPRST